MMPLNNLLCSVIRIGVGSNVHRLFVINVLLDSLEEFWSKSFVGFG